MVDLMSRETTPLGGRAPEVTLEVVGQDRAQRSATSAPAIPSPAWMLAGIMSIAAGLVHGAVIGAHGDNRFLVWMFSLAAIAQVSVGLAALQLPTRAVATAVAVVNIGSVMVWTLTRTIGIGFVASLKAVEPVGLTDGACAFLGLIAGVAALAALRPRRPVGFPAAGAVALPVILAAGLLVVPALGAAGSHSHAAAHVHDAAAASTGSAGGAASSTASSTATLTLPTPFDPTKPVNLSGTPGVTPAQQTEAEALLTNTLAKLPQFADPAYAVSKGYRSIGDGYTGHEHYIKWDEINDTTFFDPDHPESLVYRTTGGGKQLEAVMFLLPSSMTLETVPKIGGPLIQFHIHNNLCFTEGEAPVVIGLTDSTGGCRRGKKFTPSPMFHVWIKPKVCGPFAALEGIAGGQVREGEAVSCDHVHGSSKNF